MKLKLTEIVVPDGRREINDTKVSVLAESIKIVGLLNPITVDKDNVLIAGLHRLEAYKTLGFDAIECVVLNCDELHAELAEIDENLIRNELHYTERGDYLERRKEIYEELFPETKAGVAGGKARQNSANEIISFAENTANKIGASKRTIEQEIQISKSLTPEVKSIIREKDVPKTEALKIARLEPEQQKEAVAKIVSGEAQSAAKVSREKKPVYADPADDEPPGGWAPQKFQSAQGIYDVFVLDVLYEFSEEELSAWSLPAADDCHLWLWTAHEHLPLALRVLAAWGFQYEHIFAWYKNNEKEFGIDESRLYPCEFALYARRGNPQFATTERVMTGVYTSGGANLGKPDAFYDLVKQSTTGRRADICGSRNIEGFDLCGSEGLTKE